MMKWPASYLVTAPDRQSELSDFLTGHVAAESNRPATSLKDVNIPLMSRELGVANHTMGVTDTVPMVMPLFSTTGIA